MIRLGVNIDHVATLRQARGEVYPQISRAAQMALENGADQITIHLRKDRRHIQDYDLMVVKKICADFNKPLNLEIGSDPEIVDIALKTSPDWLCIVPENRQEITTEGGLDVKSTAVFQRTKEVMKTVRSHCKQTQISLFVESNQEVLQKCVDLGADACEIHTGEYAKAILENFDYSEFLTSFAHAKQFLSTKKLGCHAGHGLTLESLKPLVDHHLFVEYNIGHWIISEAVFQGLDKVIASLKTYMNKESF